MTANKPGAAGWGARAAIALGVQLFFAPGAGAVENGLILVTDYPSAESKEIGEAGLKTEAFSPASTFKVILAWAGLAEGIIGLDDRREVGDRHVPGTPREVGLEEAMYYSSNDFFVRLGREVGRERIEGYMRRSGLFGEVLPPDWLGSDWRMVVKAGTLTVTPLANHRWMCRVAGGLDGVGNDVREALARSMRWPSSDAAVSLHGKTGVYGGAVWYNGYGRRDDGTCKVVTVLLRGSVERREEAIGHFYSQFGQTWKPEPAGR